MNPQDRHDSVDSHGGHEARRSSGLRWSCLWRVRLPKCESQARGSFFLNGLFRAFILSCFGDAAFWVSAFPQLSCPLLALKPAACNNRLSGPPKEVLNPSEN